MRGALVWLAFWLVFAVALGVLVFEALQPVADALRIVGS